MGSPRLTTLQSHFQIAHKPPTFSAGKANMTNTPSFPKQFLWGAATSSYQIEGATTADGRSESIWDRFAATPGKVVDGSSGAQACEHYQRYKEDVELMQQLGVQAYRFSIAWPRVLPAGRGTVNQAGLDFYSRLVDALLASGIQPFATLYHWDLPQVLQEAGGWPQRATAEAFVEFADATSRALGDRVKNWITHNEPWCAAFLSYQLGEHAPGWTDWRAAIDAGHHLLLSHGWAVPVLRANSPQAEVGIALNFTPVEAGSTRAADVAAVRMVDGYQNRWFIDPLFGRHYPADMMADYITAGHLPATGMDCIKDGDLSAIAAPLDFLGVNYYTRTLLGGDAHSATPPAQFTDMDWEVYPHGLYALLNRLHFEYHAPKLYITESGCAYNDTPDAGGCIRDTRRVAYLHGHIAAVHRALQNGARIAGYFVWSLLDNYEWAKGYTQRFGIVWVNFETQQRVPKDSAAWYARLIAAGTLPDAGP